MLNNVTVSFSGTPAAILQLLTAAAHLGDPFQDVDVADQNDGAELPYSAPNTGALVSLSKEQFAPFFEGMDPGYQEGIRLLAERGGTVSYDELRQKGIRNPGHFKSRTSLRAKNVVGSNRRVQFASYFYKMKDGEAIWYLRVTPTTLASMQSYFADQSRASS